MNCEACGEEPPLKRMRSQADADDLSGEFFEFMQRHYGSEPDKVTRKAFLDMCVTDLKFELDDTELSRVLDALDSNGDQVFDRAEITEAIRNVRLIRLKLRSFIQHQRHAIHDHFPARDFDFAKTTKENYKADADVGDEPPHARERAALRAGYHKQVYSRARQQWQDEVVEQAATPMMKRDEEEPWLIYTCGTPGAGKGFVMSWLSNQGFFPLETVVHVDPDNFKLHMPEWPGYQKMGETSVDKVCGNEANFLADLTQEAALSRGSFVWRDTTLLAADRIKEYMKSLRERAAQEGLPKYKIAVFYIFADEDVVRRRIEEREAQTGRSVDDSFLEASFANIKKSLTTVQDEVDIVAMIDNSGKKEEPILTSLLTVDRSHDWKKVEDMFSTHSVRNAHGK